MGQVARNQCGPRPDQNDCLISGRNRAGRSRPRSIIRLPPLALSERIGRRFITSKSPITKGADRVHIDAVFLGKGREPGTAAAGEACAAKATISMAEASDARVASALPKNHQGGSFTRSVEGTATSDARAPRGERARPGDLSLRAATWERRRCTVRCRPTRAHERSWAGCWVTRANRPENRASAGFATDTVSAKYLGVASTQPVSQLTDPSNPATRVAALARRSVSSLALLRPSGVLLRRSRAPTDPIRATSSRLASAPLPRRLEALETFPGACGERSQLRCARGALQGSNGCPRRRPGADSGSA